jgi:hypothetical protein
VTFINCVFRNNTAEGDNGAILNASAGQLCDKTITLINCTLSLNSAGVSVGAIGNGGIANLTNSIVWNNSAPSNPNLAGSGTYTINYSDVQGPVQGSSPPAGNGNTNVNPQFFDANLRLSHLSPTPVIDGGQGTIPVDTYNVDDDTDLTELTPDLDRKPRSRGNGPDMGAFERYEPGACPGDVNGDGLVDVDDLIHVILNWGQPDASGVYDVDDMIAVILGWGPCPGNSGLTDDMPQSIQDCMDECTQAGLEGEEWEDCFMKCYEAIQQ